MMNVLILDNYDSFTYNLVHYLEESLGRPVTVRRNDEIDIDEVGEYDLIVLSPGPGVPAEAGIMPELIRRYRDSKILFGVCLGHQAIGEAYGARLHNLERVHHGIETEMRRTTADDIIFTDVPQIFRAGRYHSWVIDPQTLPDDFIVTATDDVGGIMAMRHRDLPIFSVQFHPESIMTEHGRKMIDNLLNFARQQISTPV
jgi:anthranilate synthase component 2